jgi:hypothetical protein
MEALLPVCPNRFPPVLPNTDVDAAAGSAPKIDVDGVADPNKGGAEALAAEEPNGDVEPPNSEFEELAGLPAGIDPNKEFVEELAAPDPKSGAGFVAGVGELKRFEDEGVVVPNNDDEDGAGVGRDPNKDELEAGAPNKEPVDEPNKGSVAELEAELNKEDPVAEKEKSNGAAEELCDKPGPPNVGSFASCFCGDLPNVGDSMISISSSLLLQGAKLFLSSLSMKSESLNLLGSPNTNPFITVPDG